MHDSFTSCGDSLPNAVVVATRVVSDIAQRLHLGVANHPGKPPFIERRDSIAQELQLHVVANEESGWEVRQKIWPADTVAQARAFFSKVDPDAFFGLVGRGWRVLPNLHFSFMSSHLVHATSAITSVDFYCLYRSGAEVYGGRPTDPESLRPALDGWVDRKLISAKDGEEIRQRFLETRRQHINVIPGFQLIRRWSRAELAKAEAASVLRDRLIDGYREAVSTWGETLDHPSD